MGRLKILFFAIHAAQADRGLNNSEPTQSKLHAINRVVDVPTIGTGLQSGIISVGNEPQSDASLHILSGGAAPVRGLAQATGSNVVTDLAPAIFIGALVVLFGFVAFGYCSFRGQRLSDVFRWSQAKGRMAPSIHQEEWALGNSRELGPLECENLYAGKAQMLVGEVSAITGALNTKVLAVEEGYCIVRSRDMHLLWRNGMKAKAYAAMSITVAGEWLPTDDVDSEETETVAPQDDAALYDSLRQLSKRIEGPVTKFPSNAMNALIHGTQSRYIVVKPSCDSNPSRHWRNAQVNFFKSKGDFDTGAEPHRSVRVCDIVNVSWFCQPRGSAPQIILTTNQQAASSGTGSSSSFHEKETYLGRQTKDATEQLQKDLIELSDLVEQFDPIE